METSRSYIREEDIEGNEFNSNSTASFVNNAPSLPFDRLRVRLRRTEEIGQRAWPPLHVPHSVYDGGEV